MPQYNVRVVYDSGAIFTCGLKADDPDHAMSMAKSVAPRGDGLIAVYPADPEA